MRAGRAHLYFFGFLRKSTNSMISTLASSQPATSLNMILSTLVLSMVPTLARDCVTTQEARRRRARRQGHTYISARAQIPTYLPTYLACR